MVDEQLDPAVATPHRQSARREAILTIGLLGLLGAVVYLAIAFLRARLGLPVPDSVLVAVPFLLVPTVYFHKRRVALAFGPLDRTWAFSAGCYAPFAAWIVAAEPGARGYFIGLASSVASVPAALWWSLDTYFHVGAVDYFTKRVVQKEAEGAWGALNGLLLQWVAWCAGHVLEWLWLRFILGDVGAALYLASAGIVTGLAFARWKNVGGLMAGHFLVNVAAASAAVVLFT